VHIERIELYAAADAIGLICGYKGEPEPRKSASSDRQARNHHIHRNAGLGQRRSVTLTFGISHWQTNCQQGSATDRIPQVCDREFPGRSVPP
jgi:hypothetical protein